MAREGPSSLQAATSVTLRETQGSRRNSQGEVPLSGAQALGIRPGAAAVHCNSECGCQKKSRLGAVLCWPTMAKAYSPTRPQKSRPPPTRL
jgi:hypothetical protein